jgi:hypothetical protein
MSLETKLKDSKLSLEGNGFNPQPKTVSWGFQNPNVAAPLNSLDPKLSALQYTYGVDTNPANVKIVSFNKTQYKPYLPTESQLDELDKNAPNNTQVGAPRPNGGPVASQIYKSPLADQYRSKGPKDGRY